MALTLEVTAVVQEATKIAKCRYHARVTPLHVAAAMFTIWSDILRPVFLQPHIDPHQYQALHLFCNVALNRLPTFFIGPFLGPNRGHGPIPVHSDELVATFQRAQMHQRDGFVGIHELIMCILDDPTVSRVMSEAGFCSGVVKTRIEQAKDCVTAKRKSEVDSNWLTLGVGRGECSSSKNRKIDLNLPINEDDNI